MDFWQAYADFVRKYLNPRKDAGTVGGIVRQGAEEARQLRGKEVVDVGGRKYRLVPVRTRVVTEGDEIGEIVETFVGPHLRDGDIIAISESLVAITQGRAFTMGEVRAGFFAKLLYPWVTHVTYGTGLGCPASMQKAIEDVGLGRILGATFGAVVGKVVGRRGLFYAIAGERVRSIDVRWNHAIPLKGARDYIILSPLNLEGICAALNRKSGHPVAIVDVNDVGSRVLAQAGLTIPVEELAQALRGNPAGQGGEQTPVVLVRPQT